MTEANAHQELLCSVLKRPLTEEDALLWMTLLHTHTIRLRPEALSRNGALGASEVLPPETQRGAAELIAALWPDRHDERAGYLYWYWQYNTKTPYEVLDDVPAELRPRLLQLRDLLAQEPRVIAVTEED